MGRTHGKNFINTKVVISDNITLKHFPTVPVIYQYVMAIIFEMLRIKGLSKY